jgi:LysM repeat protein
MGAHGIEYQVREPDRTSDGTRYVSVIPDEAELVELWRPRLGQPRGWLLVVGVVALAAAMVVGLAQVGVVSIGPRPEKPATIAELLASPRPSADEASPSGGAPIVVEPTIGPTASPTIAQGVTAAPSPTPSLAPTPSPGPVIVIVVAGDSLSAIAAQHGAALADVLGANPQIVDPALIHVGDRITIPWAAVNQLVGGSHDVVPAYVAGTAEACAAYGWAFDPNDRMVDVTVRVLVDGKVRTSVVANEYRQDLAPYGIGGDGTPPSP